MNDILYRALAAKLYRSMEKPAAHRALSGAEHIDKVVQIDQAPIGRTPRSNPATYTGVFAPIRELYAMLPESRERGYKPGRFSFNVKGGRCEACQGDGQRRIEMNFLPDVYVTCEVCRGKRYNAETLAVRYKGCSISDLLDLPIEEALKVLENIPAIQQKLQTLVDVGLGYVQLGQSATTLSGGEAQRTKLARELSRRQTGRTLYILDEPTTGLHFDDVKKLLDVLNRLVTLGNTVLIIEHNLDVIKQADWIIDLGPEGGEAGGRIVAQGTPEQVARIKKSYTGQILARALCEVDALRQRRMSSRRQLDFRSEPPEPGDAAPPTALGDRELGSCSRFAIRRRETSRRSPRAVGLARSVASVVVARELVGRVLDSRRSRCAFVDWPLSRSGHLRASPASSAAVHRRAIRRSVLSCCSHIWLAQTAPAISARPSGARSAGARSRLGKFPRALRYFGFVVGGFLLALIGSGRVARVSPPKAKLPIQQLFQDRRTALASDADGRVRGAVVEETIFRGYIYPVVARSFGIRSRSRRHRNSFRTAARAAIVGRLGADWRAGRRRHRPHVRARGHADRACQLSCSTSATILSVSFAFADWHLTGCASSRRCTSA